MRLVSQSDPSLPLTAVPGVVVTRPLKNGRGLIGVKGMLELDKCWPSSKRVSDMSKARREAVTTSRCCRSWSADDHRFAISLQ